MKFNLKKILKSSLITLAAFGIIGGTCNESVSAKRRSYRIHRVYRHRRYHHSKHSQGVSKYLYRLHNWKYIKNASIDVNMSPRQLMRKHGHHGYLYAYNIWGEFDPAYDLQNFVKNKLHEPLLKYLQQNGGGHGPFKAYTDNILNVTSYYTKAQLTGEAHMDGLSTNAYLKKYYTKNPSNDNTDDTSTTPESQHPTYSTTELQQQMANATVNDVASDRAANGLASYNTSDMDLNNFAEQRAEQLPNDFSHDNAPSNGGENIAYVTLGNTSIAGDPNQYDNHNGNDMAKEVEDSFMNYDGDQGNVHRDNILGDYNNMGVGVYSPDGNTFYLAEDFE